MPARVQARHPPVSASSESPCRDSSGKPRSLLHANAERSDVRGLGAAQVKAGEHASAFGEVIQRGLRSLDPILPDQGKGVKAKSLIISLEPLEQLCIYRWSSSSPSPAYAAKRPTLAF
jgi:hypothetical protein